MTNAKDAMLVRALREAAHQLVGSARDYDPLLELIGDARFVLLGEASHGITARCFAAASSPGRLVGHRGVGVSLPSCAPGAPWHGDRIISAFPGCGDAA
jgi:hypothetical protein